MPTETEVMQQETSKLEEQLRRDWPAGFAQIQKELARKSENQRRDLYALLWRLGQESTDAARRQQIVQHLTSRVEIETPFLRQQLLKWLQDFQAADFNAEAKRQLGELSWSGPEAPSIIRLVGIADLRDALPRLKTLAKNDPVKPVAGQWYGSTTWAAMLAVSRMGDQDTLQRVIRLTETEKDIVVRSTVLFRDLGYTRQPGAFDVLRRYLASEERLPYIKPNVPGRREAAAAAGVIVQHVANCPVEETDVNDAELAKIRNWAGQQRQWQFK